MYHSTCGLLSITSIGHKLSLAHFTPLRPLKITNGSFVSSFPSCHLASTTSMCLTLTWLSTMCSRHTMFGTSCVFTTLVATLQRIWLLFLASSFSLSSMLSSRYTTLSHPLPSMSSGPNFWMTFLIVEATMRGCSNQLKNVGHGCG